MDGALKPISDLLERPTPAASAVLPSGALAELVYDPLRRTTAFALWDGERVTVTPKLRGAAGERLVPYSPGNALLRHKVVLFPSETAEYGETSDLVAAIQSYIHAYVDLPPAFERLAAYYALFSWVHDRFNELPYLRLRGDYGTGKTRFLLVLGAICYKPIFASGASTVAPLFHMLDKIGGTLVIDEADFRFTDEKADLAKILNNGNVRGFPVLRMESPNGREFNPRAFQVFGPKIVGMRGSYDDAALESRFITETTGGRPLRPDIPLNLPPAQEGAALELRNKLLLFRFRAFHALDATPPPLDPALDPRLNQIYAPLLAVIGDAKAREALHAVARGHQASLAGDRSASVEAQVLTAIRSLAETSASPAIGVKEVTALFARAFASDYAKPPTARFIGHVVRRKLNLLTRKSHGVFVIPLTERTKLDALYARFGVTREDAEALDPLSMDLAGLLRFEPVDFGDVGDVGPGRAVR